MILNFALSIHQVIGKGVKTISTRSDTMKLRPKTVQTKLLKALKKTSHQKVPRLSQKVRKQICQFFADKKIPFYDMILHEGLQFVSLHTCRLIYFCDACINCR